MQYGPAYAHYDSAAYAQTYGQYGDQYGQYGVDQSGQPLLEQAANVPVNQEQKAGATTASKPSLATGDKKTAKKAEAEPEKGVVKEQPKKLLSWPPSGYMLAIVALVLIGAVVAMMSVDRAVGYAAGTETVEEPDMVTVAGGSDGQPQFPDGILVYTHPRRHDRITAATVTDAEHTEETTTEEFVAEQDMSPAPLVCTMGIKTNSPKMFPTDGLCEYIFYDSVFKEGFREFEPQNLDTNLRTFIEARKDFGQTEFGIGLAFKYAQDIKEYLAEKSTSAPYMVGYFWRQRIFHFGILDTPTREIEESSVVSALETLKILNEISYERRRLGDTCFMVFAALIPDDDWEGFYVDRFSTIFTPHLFISVGHYERGDNTLHDCRVMPPTLLKKPDMSIVNDSYQHDLTTAAERLESLAAHDVQAAWAISVTMKGRWTLVEDNEPLDFLSRCVHEPQTVSFGSIAEVCKHPKYGREYNYSEEVHAAQFQYSTDRRLFSFDNEVAFCQKLCRLKADHVSNDIGIAVFDLDYEDFSNACASTNWGGSFSRLRSVQLLLNFMKVSFKDKSLESVCLKLIE